MQSSPFLPPSYPPPLPPSPSLRDESSFGERAALERAEVESVELKKRSAWCIEERVGGERGIGERGALVSQSRYWRASYKPTSNSPILWEERHRGVIIERFGKKSVTNSFVLIGSIKAGLSDPSCATSGPIGESSGL